MGSGRNVALLLLFDPMLHSFIRLGLNMDTHTHTHTKIKGGKKPDVEGGKGRGCLHGALN